MNVGDRVMLFLDFPFDFAAERSIDLGSVVLDDTPQQRLADSLGVASFLIPDYGLPTGIVNCVLHTHGQLADENARDRPFFDFLANLRLWQPFPISIGGSYTVGNGDNEFYFAGPLRSYNLRTLGGRFPADRHIGAADLQMARTLSEVLENLDAVQYEKIKSAAICFTQVTLGLVQAFQPAVVTLFSSLEALFTNGNAQPRELARRTARFLGAKDLGFDIEQWIRDTYNRMRGRYSHGRYDILPEKRLRDEHAADFHRLHEMARVALLGVLTKPHDWQTHFASLSGTALRELDVVDAADSDTFLESACWT